MRDGAVPSVIVDADTEKTAEVLEVDATDRLAVQAAMKPGSGIVIGGPVPADLTLVVRDRVKDGANDSLVVNGDGSPKTYLFSADPTQDILLNELRFVLVANTIKVTGDRFGPLATLAFGVTLEVRAESKLALLVTVKVTEDFLDFYSPGGIFFDRSGDKDVLIVGLHLGGAPKLVAGSADFVKVVIQDNLSQGAAMQHFSCTVYGVKV